MSPPARDGVGYGAPVVPGLLLIPQEDAPAGGLRDVPCGAVTAGAAVSQRPR